jgi:hypothetical protein
MQNGRISLPLPLPKPTRRNTRSTQTRPQPDLGGSGVQGGFRFPQTDLRGRRLSKGPNMVHRLGWAHAAHYGP